VYASSSNGYSSWNNWSVKDLGVNGKIIAIACHEETIAIVTVSGSVSYIFVSYNNGATWTNVRNTTSLGYKYTNLIWDGLSFIANTDSSVGVIDYSFDGTIWQSYSPSFGSLNGIGMLWTVGSVGKGKIQQPTVIGGNDVSGSSMLYSLDGVVYYSLNNSSLMNQVNDIAWNGVMYVAVGSGDNYTAAYSYNGISWVGLSIFGTSGLAVLWNGVCWLAVGSGDVYYSYDGVNWMDFVISSGSANRKSIGWNGDHWLVGDASGNVYSSSNVDASVSNAWVLVGKVASFDTINSISWLSNHWVISGSGGIAYASNTDMLTNTWVISSGVPSGFVGQSVDWNGKIAVAVGSTSNSTPTILYSKNDGHTWTTVLGLMFSIEGYKVKWNGLYWIAVGNGVAGSVIYSKDGISWFTGVGTNGLGVGHAIGCNSGLGVVSVPSALNVASGSSLVVRGPGSYSSNASVPTAISFPLEKPGAF